MNTVKMNAHILPFSDILESDFDSCNDYVWVEIKGWKGIDSDKVFYLRISDIDSDSIDFEIPHDTISFLFDDYEIEYRVWSICPSDDDRKANPWKGE